MSLFKKNRIKPVTLLLHSLIWGSIILFPLLFDPLTRPYPDRFRPDSVQFRIFLMALFYFNTYFLIGKFFNRKKLVTYVSSLILSFVLLIALPMTFRRLMPPPNPPNVRIDGRGPLQSIPDRRSMVNSGNKRSLIFHGHTYVIQGMAVLIISTAFGLMIKYDKQNKERETENLKSELSFLRSQINPHFMLNTINNLVSLARKKSELLEPSLIKLSGIMKYMLYEPENEKVEISQEVEYLKNYIELQRLRYDEDIVICAELNNYTPGFKIAPMILIPFVENAFKHGVVLSKKPEININLILKDDILSFIVKNKFNSGEKEEKDKNPGIGLINVKRRLELIYPDKHQLDINDQLGWFIINLSITLS